MTDHTTMLLKANLKQLRLPTIAAEFAKLAREASEGGSSYAEYLLRLTELEVSTRTANALRSRIKQAHYPVMKELESYDFSLMPGLNKHKFLELMRCDWIGRHHNCCLIGSPGTGKTHLAIALSLAACRQGYRVRFFTAADLVTRLEEAQEQYRLERLLTQLDKTDLLVIDELGYLPMNKQGNYNLFQLINALYEYRSIILTTNKDFTQLLKRCAAKSVKILLFIKKYHIFIEKLRFY
jgi:DNA replication protein DnaC